MTGTTGGRAHRLVTPAVMLAPRVRTGVESGGGGPGVVRDMAPEGSVEVGVEGLIGSKGCRVYIFGDPSCGTEFLSSRPAFIALVSSKNIYPLTFWGLELRRD